MTFGKEDSPNWNLCVGSNAQYFLSNMTENRKRSREDDVCEFMPLSKRINNLHINNNLATTSAQSRAECSHTSHGLTDNGISTPISSPESECRPNYDPGLNASQSNYYFDNKLLFELHLERIQRSGQSFPF